MKHLKPKRASTKHDTRGTAPFAEAALVQLVDEMIQVYVNWRKECAEVAVSYENWRCAAAADKTLAFSAYLAALDREQHAAGAYQRIVAQIAVM